MAELENIGTKEASESPPPTPPVKTELPDKGMIYGGLLAARLFKKGAVVYAVRVTDPDNMEVGVVIHFTKDEAAKLTGAIRDILRERLEIDPE